MASSKLSKFRKAIIAVVAVTGIGYGAAEILVPTVAEYEGEVLTTYKDVVGIDTVCFGDTRPEWAVPGVTYTEEECLMSLSESIIEHTRGMLECAPGVEASDEMTAAFGSLTINIGVGAFCRSTVARRFKAGDYRGACEAIPMWNKAGGKVNKGLVRRRDGEMKLCLRGVPAMEAAR
jgi:Phage-related lysozyme (muraminidase)